MQLTLDVVMYQDEDYLGGKDDGGSPTDDSGEEESDASESGYEIKASYLIFFHMQLERFHLC